MGQRKAVASSPRGAPTRAAEETRRAIEMHRAGQLDEAGKLYRKVLQYAPRHADAWHFQGMLKYQTGDAAAGIRDIRRALEYAPRYADAYANIAIIHLDQRDYAECERCLRQVLALTPKALPPRATLATLYRAQGRHGEAEAVVREALVLESAAPDPERRYALLCSLGNILVATNRPEEGIEAYREAVRTRPDSRDVRAALGYALCRTGRFEEAAATYREILACDPNDVRVRHLLAACSGAQVPDRAEDEYVRQVFDAFSVSFDQKLASLGYRAPELLENALRESLGESCGGLRLLDAGCGTGLYGERVRQYCSRLVGVDLSSGMLRRARERNIYDDLHEAELASWLNAHPAEFDVVASADTLIYFGALETAVQSAFAALRGGGCLLFTLEHLHDPTHPFRLQHHGRYAHAEPYVRSVLDEAGFEQVRIVHDQLRMESGVPVAGLVVAACRARP